MKYDITKNIIILGEHNSGKTTLINNYLFKITENNPTTTIGIDYYKKTSNINNENCLVNIWDTGNGLLYRNILDHYMEKSQLFVIIVKEQSIKFIIEVFNVIHTEKKINPENIFIIYNKILECSDFTFDEARILKYKPTNTNIHFKYINIFNKTSVDNLFEDINTTLFNKSIIYKTKSNKKLIPLNIEQNSQNSQNSQNFSKNESKSKKDTSCHKCCIIC